jgi:hypothetical protein
MSRVHFRNPEVRLSVALEATRQAVAGHQVTLREILSHVGEQGLLVFCAILAMPFLFPMSLPGMSTALGAPMLLIGYAVTMNRTPWLPDRLLDHALPTATVQHVLERAVHAADRFEHLVRPRLLGLTGTPGVNVINGVVLIPLANTLPGIAIILLCLGMAERDGWLLLGGHFVALVSLLYVGLLLYFAVKLGSDPRAALEAVQQLMARALGH